MSGPGQGPPVDPLELATAYQRSAVVAAACATGLAPRLAADPGRSLDFLRALDDLATRFAGELPGLAGLQGPGRLLEVGGGAGSHAAALARAAPGLEATVLDLPAVEPVLRERHPELAFVAGDLTGAELRRGAGPIAVVAARAPGPPDPPGA